LQIIKSRRKRKKAFVIFLSMLLLISAIQPTVFAEEPEASEELEGSVIIIGDEETAEPEEELQEAPEEEIMLMSSSGRWTMSMKTMGVFMYYNGTGYIEFSVGSKCPDPKGYCCFKDIPIHYLNSSGNSVVAFCVQPWLGSQVDDAYVESDGTSDWDNYPAGLKRAVAMTMYYGAPNLTIPTDIYSVDDGLYMDVIQAATTQVIIYELCAGLRDWTTFAYTASTRWFENGSERIYAMYNKSYPLETTTKFRETYYYLENRLMNAGKIPSFTKRSPSLLNDATAIELEWNESENAFIATVEDTNNVLREYDFSQCNGEGLTFETSGNTLTIRAEKGAVGTIRSDRSISCRGELRSVDPEKAVIAYTDVSNGSNQDLVTRNPGYSGDPITCYLNLSISKSSLTVEKQSPDGNVKGIRFVLTSGEYTEEAETDENGICAFTGLEEGSYVLHEITPENCREQEDITIEIPDKEDVRVTVVNRPVRFSIELTKKDKESKEPLKDAVYGVYRNDDLIDEYTTDKEGKITTKSYPAGEGYELREIRAPEGYELDPEVISLPVSLDDCKEDTVTIALEKFNDPIYGGIRIQKKDAEQDDERSSGGATLEGAVYEVSDNKGVVILTLTTDTMGRAESAANELRYGEYILKEKEAPEGYLLSANRYPFTIQIQGEVIDFTGENALKEELIRGNLKLQKVNGETGEPMVHIPFLLTNTDTGEEHLLLTDDHGYLDTSSVSHGSQTNAYDSMYSDGEVRLPEEITPAGIWFYGNKEQKGTVIDGKGALPYGSYRLEELSCSGNEGFILTDPIEFSVEEDKVLIDLKQIENFEPEQIRTTARSKDTEDKLLPADSGVTILDTVSYSGLNIGEEYRLKGTLVNASTGQSLKDENGRDITVETAFVPTKRQGEQNVEFQLDTTELTGCSIVVFEQLFDVNGELRASHEDPKDTEQTVMIPKICTTAAGLNGEKELCGENEIYEIVDTVSYTNLIPGKTYRLEGTLMNAETEEPVKNAEGEVVSSILEFTPQESSGKETMLFSVPSKDVEGNRFVVYENLYYGNLKLTGHEDPKDEDQTVYVPKIETRAVSGSGTGEVFFDQNAETVCFTDDVTYTGLAAGREHVLIASLWDRNAGRPIVDENGKMLTVEHVLVPKSESGTEKVTFEIPAKLLDGASVTVFEILELNGKVTARHEDPNAEEQFLIFPKRSSLFKYDASSLKGIPGAKILLTDMTDSTVQVLLSDEEGFAYFSGFAGHSYTFTEEEAPEGYLQDSTIYSFTILEDGTTQGDTSIMNVRGGTIVLSKKDVISGDPVEGAVIQICDEKGNVAAEKTTDKEGKIYFYTENYGKYTYREIKAPAGYYLNEEIYSFEMKKDGSVTGTLVFTDVPLGTVVIKKTDEAGNPLGGAQIRIYRNSDNTVVGTAVTNTKGRIYFVSPGPGIYYFKELVPPAGYELSDRQETFTVMEDGTITGVTTLTNKKLPSGTVATGDTMHPELYLGMIGLSFILCAGGILWIRRKKDGRRNKARYGK